MQRGGVIEDVIVDPLSDDVVILADIPVRQPHETYRHQLTEMCQSAKDPALFRTESTRFASEDVWKNDSLSTYAEFLLTPLLNIRSSELDSRFLAPLFPCPVFSEADVDTMSYKDGDVNSVFADYDQYRKSMSHCLLHEAAASIASDYAELTSDRPNVTMKVLKAEHQHRALLSLTAKVPSVELLAAVKDEALLRTLTQEQSVGFIELLERDGCGVSKVIDLDAEVENRARSLATITSVRVEGGDHVFNMIIRRSSIPSIHVNAGKSFTDIYLRFQKISSLLSKQRQLNALIRLEKSNIKDLILRPNSKFLFTPRVKNDSFSMDEGGKRYNASQRLAINTCVFMVKESDENQAVTQPRFSLIHGPPGTGKSQVIISIILELQRSYSELRAANMKKMKRMKKNERVESNGSESGGILLCAPSNVAVDQLLIRLLQRISQMTESPFVKSMKIARWGRDDKIDDRVKHLRPKGSFKVAEKILMDADVIACTLNSAGTVMMTTIGARSNA